MWLVRIFLVFCVLCAYKSQATNTEDCETLQARCRICVRTLQTGPNEDNLLGRLNRKCQQKVGRKYVWEDLNRCDMVYMRCKGMNVKMDCEMMAQLHNMKIRLR